MEGEIVVTKGTALEEVLRAYFAQQGFFALRGVNLQFEEEIVTDIDIWLYGRHSASVRTRTIVDVKNKRSPKAFERILWTRGMQLALGCDRAIVATTYSNPKVKKFALEQNVSLLNKDFLSKLQKQIDTSRRITSEQFADLINAYPDHKLDGDWLRLIANAKSGLVSLSGYPAFNRAMTAFRFFAERADTRLQHREQAVRSAFLTAGLACIALDSALERTLYERLEHRRKAIEVGVTFGDAGDERVQKSIFTLLDIISSGMENGHVVSRQVEDALTALFNDIRADVIGEYFSIERNASILFEVAKELDNRAYAADGKSVQNLSVAAKSVIGVFSDYMNVERRNVLDAGFATAHAKTELNTPNKTGNRESVKKTRGQLPNGKLHLE